MTEVKLDDYYMGRDATHGYDLTAAIEANAKETVSRVNLLLRMMGNDEVPIRLRQNGSIVSSGWRPPEINAATPGAAVRSKHTTGQACDLFDPDGALDEWCVDNLAALSAIQLWLEHPAATKNWCHVQTVPPRSGRRIFYP